MSTSRLTFLYPHLFRSLRASDSISQTVQNTTRLPRRQCHPRRGFSSAGRRRESLVQRHGKAVEPFLVKGETPESVKLFTPESEGKEKSKDEQNFLGQSEASAEKYESKQAEQKTSSAAPLSKETQAAGRLPGDSDSVALGGKTETKDAEKNAVLEAAVNKKDTAKPVEKPLDTVLHMPPPKSQAETEAAKPPHLRTPPYVHHFDMYTLVQKVEEGGFTPEQSITAMKAVRWLLAQNLGVARAGLVSKSDVENESYLFRAACSELRIEIQNQRKANDEKMRQERTLLQHELDILTQKMTQDLLTLRDDLKGMFDDRKMAVRTEQRAVESAIQQLNYKITVDLNSDSKSEVEGVRWLLTRRSVMGILFMAFMVLTSLRYASVKAAKEKEEGKKKEQAEPKVDDIRPNDHGALSATEILAAN
ncbi:hypothetical protein B0O99DRAFT_589796 [Bisporella sp. PMI_857]|nr:hypothetical protein B0O99DRAFT_589796 [Bisporella sp. PMI_857]